MPWKNKTSLYYTSSLYYSTQHDGPPFPLIPPCVVEARTTSLQCTVVTSDSLQKCLPSSGLVAPNHKEAHSTCLVLKLAAAQDASLYLPHQALERGRSGSASNHCGGKPWPHKRKNSRWKKLQFSKPRQPLSNGESPLNSFGRHCLQVTYILWKEETQNTHSSTLAKSNAHLICTPMETNCTHCRVILLNLTRWLTERVSCQDFFLFGGFHLTIHTGFYLSVGSHYNISLYSMNFHTHAYN